jgi:hypothetical protein
MELLFRSNASFENDLSLLDAPSRRDAVERMNALFPDYLCNRDSFCSLLENPGDTLLEGGLCSSLTVLPLGNGLSVILTIDDDPIFCQVIITLIRLVPASESSVVFNEVREMLNCALAATGAGGSAGRGTCRTGSPFSMNTAGSSRP